MALVAAATQEEPKSRARGGDHTGAGKGVSAPRLPGCPSLACWGPAMAGSQVAAGGAEIGGAWGVALVAALTVGLVTLLSCLAAYRVRPPPPSSPRLRPQPHLVGGARA